MVVIDNVINKLSISAPERLLGRVIYVDSGLEKFWLKVEACGFGWLHGLDEESLYRSVKIATADLIYQGQMLDVSNCD